MTNGGLGGLAVLAVLGEIGGHYQSLRIESVCELFANIELMLKLTIFDYKLSSQFISGTHFREEPFILR